MSSPAVHARHRAPRRSLAGAVVASLIAALLVFAASPAAAASEATYVDGGATMTIFGSSPNAIGGATSFPAGEMLLRFGSESGDPTYVGYCIDIGTTIGSPTGGLKEQDWTDVVPEHQKIQGIVNTFSSTGSFESESSDEFSRAEKAAAIQAAIWHYSDAFELNTDATHADVVTLYGEILEAAEEDGFGATSENPSISVTPDEGTAPEGTATGPFEVEADGAVELSVTGDAAIVDADGDPLEALTDGGEFWVTNDGVGEETVTIEGEAVTIPSGRVFAKPGVQRLVLAEAGSASSLVTVTAKWTEVERGSLTITKNIEGEVDETGEPVGEPDFTVRIEGPDGSELVRTLAPENYYTVLVDDLLPGEYTVTEVSVDPAPMSITYSSEGGVVTVPAGGDASITITNTYYDGAEPSVELDEECGVGITGTLYNEGDVPVTFTVTIDGDSQDITVPAGESTVLETEGAAEVTVTGPGIEDSISFDPGGCWTPAPPSSTTTVPPTTTTTPPTTTTAPPTTTEPDSDVGGEGAENTTTSQAPVSGVGGGNGTLPRTGGNSMTMVIAAGVVTLLGMALIGLGSRRRQAAVEHR